jgi:predicted metal-dependent peptidase
MMSEAEAKPIDLAKVHEGLRKAKANLVLDHPFFGSLALKLNYVPTDKVKYMHVDGVNLFYNPETINELNEEQLVGGIAQNVMHCALGHVVRRGDRDSKKWDRACDNAVNIILNDCKDIELPPESPCDLQYKDMTAEVIYNKLEDEDGDDDGDGPGAEGYSGINQAPTGGDSSNDPSGGDGKTTTQSDQELGDDWKISTAQAAKAAKMAGNLPGGIEDIMLDILAPKVQWKEVLRRFLTQTDKSDYSWSRGNRRYLAQGLYLPSAWSESLGEIVIAIDDSCSVSNDEIQAFQSEINGILQDAPPKKVHVLMCNTRVHRCDEYAPDDLPLQLQSRGSGGTAFKPVFDYIEEHQIPCVACIYMTDLYGDTNFTVPEYPTLWIATARGAPDPEFGERIHLEISD